MRKFIICPACGTKNSVDELLCSNCRTSLAGLPFIEEPIEQQIPQSDEKSTFKRDEYDKTIVEQKKYVLLEFNGNEFKVYDGEIIGRHGKGSEYFSGILEVSRKHAKITFENKEAYIFDLDSTNGVFVNGKRVQGINPAKLFPGASIRLCSKVVLTVRDIFVPGNYTQSLSQGRFQESELSDKEELVNFNKVDSGNYNRDVEVTMTCKKCGFKVPPGNTLCPNCLEPLE